jgi:predicted metal-dependent hydrolase
MWDEDLNSVCVKLRNIEQVGVLSSYRNDLNDCIQKLKDIGNEVNDADVREIQKVIQEKIKLNKNQVAIGEMHMPDGSFWEIHAIMINNNKQENNNV